MTQTTQTLKHEIVASLDRLTPESLKLLAKFVSFLRSNVANQEINEIEAVIDVDIPPRPMRIASPRLIHQHQVMDFRKEITEIETDASL